MKATSLWIVARRLTIALALTWLLAESSLRLLDLFREVPTGSLYSCLDISTDPYRLEAGTDIYMPERYGDIRYSANSHGYRDREWQRRGHPLILVLGDSVAFGLSVTAESRFPDRLEAELHLAGWPSAEVRNLAIFGYGGYEELLALEQYGSTLRPDLVVLQFYQNDFHTPAPTLSLRTKATTRQRFHALANRVLTASNAYRRALQVVDGAAYYLLHDARRLEPRRLNAAEPMQVLDLLAAQSDDRQVTAFDYILKIKSAAESIGAGFLVVSTPNEVQLFFDKWDRIDARLAGFCTRHDVTLVDTLETLRSSPGRTHLFRDGVHLSPTGHELVAQTLLPRAVALLQSRDSTRAGPTGH